MTEQIENAPVSQQTSQTGESFAVPDAYKGKGWTESVKSVDDLWKLNDNAQSLIGKRPAGIPSADAPTEEWDKFYAAAGRPEKPEAYQFSDVEGIPEGADLGPIKEKAATILHKAGLTQKQADEVWKLYLGSELAAVGEGKAAMEAKQAELDKEFDKVTAEMFGDSYDTAAKSAQELIIRHVPEEARGAYEALADNPKAMAVVIKALSGASAEIEKVKKEYGAEGKITSGDQSASISIDEARKELAALRISKEAKDFTDPKNKATIARIDELSGMVSRHYQK
jgi:hypothetical protein